MAKQYDVLPTREEAWEEWVKKGIIVDIGLRYVAAHPPDAKVWPRKEIARTVGAGTISDAALAPRWRIAAFKRTQVRLYEEKGKRVCEVLTEYVREAVQGATRTAFGSS